MLLKVSIFILHSAFVTTLGVNYSSYIYIFLEKYYFSYVHTVHIKVMILQDLDKNPTFLLCKSMLVSLSPPKTT